MNVELMKMIILNLSKYMNTPNEELESMMGISWMQFHDLVNEIRGMNPNDRKCFTCGWIGDYGEFMLINEGYECLECSDKNRTDYENRKWGGEEE